MADNVGDKEQIPGEPSQFLDPDRNVAGRLCMNRAGEISYAYNTFLSNGSVLLNVEISNDRQSHVFLRIVAPFGGIQSGECKKIPVSNRTAYWSYDGSLFYIDNTRGAMQRIYPIGTEEERLEQRQMLEYWNLREPGDASVEVNGQVWPRQGY